MLFQFIQFALFVQTIQELKSWEWLSTSDRETKIHVGGLTLVSSPYSLCQERQTKMYCARDYTSYIHCFAY